jgi:hypothetical protein
VGDLVLAHLRKEIFPRGMYNKLKMKKIGPCKIMRKFEEDAYEIELPDGVGIFPIFNIADLYPYKENEADEEETQKKILWVKQLSISENPKMEKIIDQRVSKKTGERRILNIW